MTRRVLVVEDHDDIRAMMSIMLREFGFEVLEAADGFEAIEKAAEERPDIILMDIALPVLDGLAATRAIRQHNERVPIIAVTAHGNSYIEKAIDAGCNKVILKPVQFEQLLAFIEECIASSKRPVAAGSPDIGLM